MKTGTEMARLVAGLLTEGRVPLDVMLALHEDAGGGDPVAAAWARSGDPVSMAGLAAYVDRDRLATTLLRLARPLAHRSPFHDEKYRRLLAGPCGLPRRELEATVEQYAAGYGLRSEALIETDLHLSEACDLALRALNKLPELCAAPRDRAVRVAGVAARGLRDAAIAANPKRLAPAAALALLARGLRVYFRPAPTLAGVLAATG